MATAFSRRYQSTHPWITFQLDLRKASPALWLLLGEARSKCDHVAGVPLQPSIMQELNRTYLAKGAHGTTAIEGNTLTEAEVAAQLVGELEVPPSREYQRLEVDNAIHAFNAIITRIAKEGPDSKITVEQIKSWNREVLAGLANDGVVPGEIRGYEVTVGRYRGAPAEDCEFLLEATCEWLNGDDFQDEPILRLGRAILRAVAAHLYLAWIHPFGDGNGRTARLMEFYILVNAGVPVPSAHLLSDYYNQTRPEYYRQLDRASKTGGDVLPFLEYAVRGFVEELATQIETIRQQQWSVAWRDFVNEYFQDHQHSEMQRRRQALVLDLSFSELAMKNEQGLVAKGDIQSLSPRTARFYAQKTPRTLDRDLKELVRLGLIVRAKGGRYRARRELVLAFLPPSWKSQDSVEGLESG